MVTVETRVEAAGQGAGADRVEAFVAADGAEVIVLADGAGGTGAAGARAADAFLGFVRGVFAELATGAEVGAVDLAALVEAADRAQHASRRGGETTAVVILVSGTSVRGASVGDSEAWLIGSATPTEVTVLTEGQERKPLVGSGAAVALPFGPTPLDGALVVGSDGLFKYAARAAIVGALASQAPAARLVELVRLRSGRLPDDVAVALVRPAPAAPR